MNKIIVIDDSRTARQQVRAALAEGAYEIIEAVDGADGLQALAAHPDAALAICDVNMPNMSGLELLVASRGVSSVPFVMLTTEAQPDLLRRAKDAGARGWVVKPFKPELLVAAVRRLIAPPMSSRIAGAAVTRS